MGILFVILVAIGFPLLGIRSHRLLERGFPFPPRPTFLTQTLVLLVGVAAFAAVTAHVEGVDLFPVPGDPGILALLALIGILVTLSVVPVGWRVATARQKDRLNRILPTTRKEWALYVGVALAAGIGEEMAYRGVLYELLARWTGSAAAAVVLAVASFALAHAVQGRAGVAAVAVLGFGFHALVFLGGSLYAAMAVHAAHDLVAGAWYRRLLARETPKPTPGNPEDPSERPAGIP